MQASHRPGMRRAEDHAARRAAAVLSTRENTYTAQSVASASARSHDTRAHLGGVDLPAFGGGKGDAGHAPARMGGRLHGALVAGSEDDRVAALGEDEGRSLEGNLTAPHGAARRGTGQHQINADQT